MRAWPLLLLAVAGAALPLSTGAASGRTLRAVAAQGDGGWSDTEPLVVELDRVDGREVATVRARNTSIDRILAEIGRRSGRVVEGLAGARRAALVTVDLHGRPLEQVLEYVLGGAGLRAELRPGLLLVQEDGTAGLPAERLRERAMALYLRATTLYPAHPAAERGRLSQGEVEEARDNWLGALEQYQTLLDTAPSSAYRGEAHLRAGRVLERLGRQAEAAQQYRLASAGVDAPQHAAARLGLARCQIALGNPDLAEVMVDALDDAVPATDRADAVDRGLVRARAQLLREEYVNSLASIDQLERGGLAARHSVEAMELRALCFEGLDLGREAARFWLVFARESRGAVADAAFERAAQLAADDDDPLGVMFVAAEAARAGSDAALGRLARAARLDLGLAVDLDTADTTDEERVEVCERWLAEGRVVAARPVLQVLHGRRTELPATLRPRAALAYARALHSEAGLEPALLALREGRAAIADPAERRSLDLLAAELLESAEQFQRAVAAYEGRY